MTNRNGSKGSGNQGSPKSGQFQQEFSTEFETGNDNKGKEYRSKKEVNQKRSDISHSFFDLGGYRARSTEPNGYDWLKMFDKAV